MTSRKMHLQTGAKMSRIIGECCCHKCLGTKPEKIGMYMVVCPTCGNKRCPNASDHNLPCTGSNEPGQLGSIYR